MADITIPEEWFYIICCLFVILIVLVIFLLVLIHRMKATMYKQIIEPNETAERTRTTTINSNRFNIQLEFRKDSDRLRQIYENFHNDESNSVHTIPSTENNGQTQETESADKVNDDKVPTIKSAALPELFLRQHLEEITKELINSRFKLKSLHKADNAEETYELSDLNVIKKRIKSCRVSSRIRSKSTTDLDIYDVLPERNRVIKFNVPVKEDETYSTAKNRNVIVVNDESGYQLPLSVTTTYVNSNT